jgi:arsenate reductase
MKNDIIKICKALSDPGRLEALLALDTKELCICDITEKLGLSESTVSRHMAILEKAGLVESRKDGRWRYFRHAHAEVPGAAQYAVAWIRKYIKGTDSRTPAMMEQEQEAVVCENKARVMFLCSGNSCRSQIAEAFLRKYGNASFHAFSSGIKPNGIHPMTVAVMAEVGIDISDQKAKSVLEFIGQMHFGFLITVCSRADEICPLFPGVSYRLHWPFEDPVTAECTESERINKFREVRDAIEVKVKQWVNDYEKKTIPSMQK